VRLCLIPTEPVSALLINKLNIAGQLVDIYHSPRLITIFKDTTTLCIPSPIIYYRIMNKSGAGAHRLDQLLDEFRAKLDVPTMLAVSSDYDIASQFDEVRQVFLLLSESAVEEEQTGFDPSGCGTQFLGGFDGVAEHAGREDDPTAAVFNAAEARSSSSAPTTSASRSADTDDTSELLSASTEDEPFFSSGSDVPEDTKVQNMQEIFPAVPVHTIRFVLKTTDGDLSRTFDELANRQALQESGEMPKGIDAFYVSDEEVSGGKSRKRMRKKGQNGSKLNLPYAVKSLNPETMRPENIPGGLKATTRYLAPPSSGSSSYDVYSSSSSRGPTPVSSTPRDAPVKSGGKHSSGGWQTVRGKKQASNSRPGPLAGSVLSPPAPSYNTNIQQAGDLVRRGGLYRQAATVYTERLPQDRSMRQAQSLSEAERLVDETSRPDRIDLHGVSVMDGVRITKERVARWYQALGSDRERLAPVRGGFCVVTGRGRHSAGGVSRLSQAVYLALKNDGWKVEDCDGEHLVLGRI
jgi:hypothetical protein